VPIDRSVRPTGLPRAERGGAKVHVHPRGGLGGQQYAVLWRRTRGAQHVCVCAR
jgi:hypothetical protein